MEPENNNLITDDWLREIGFRWHQMERQPNKHWVLALGDAVNDDRSFTCRDDLAIELTRSVYADDIFYNCWLRGDYSHRYSRFIHVRHLTTRRDLIRLIEGLTGLDWNPANVYYGGLCTDKQSALIRKDRDRPDRRLVEGSHPWNECEKDGTRGYPLEQHQKLLEEKQ